MYVVIKQLHIYSVMLSGIFFAVRGFWMLKDSTLLQNKLVKVLPHVIDTLLLGSAIYLTILISQYPFVDGWLTAKLLALIVYIVLGTFAIKRGKTKSLRTLCFFAALATYIYMLGVAKTHSASLGLI